MLVPASWSTPSEADSNSLSSVSCPSASFCAAVDITGNVITYNGTTWSAPQSIDAGNLIHSISCPTTSFCMAVDSTSYLVDNSGTWSTASKMNYSGYALTSVSCSSASFCAAVDQGGDAFIYSVGSWTSSYVDTFSGLTSVSCVSTSFCMAVDGYQHALTYDGTSWSAPTNIDTEGLTSVSCTSASFCTALDGVYNALTYDGTWSSPTRIESTGGLLTSVSCPSASLCVAVDKNGNTLTYNGTSWSSPIPIDGLGGLTSVSCPSPLFCAAVDNEGYALTYIATSLPSPPVNTSPPTISGATVLGAMLTETNGAWTNNPTGYSYQWQDCDASGNNCVDISGETGQTYELQYSDVGATIRVVETASNAGGDGSPDKRGGNCDHRRPAGQRVATHDLRRQPTRPDVDRDERRLDRRRGRLRLPVDGLRRHR